MKVAQSKKKATAKAAPKTKTDAKPTVAPSVVPDVRDSDELNFQKPRKKRRPDPKIAFFELFMTRMDRDGKSYQFTFRDQISRGMKWGLYKIQVMQDKLEDMKKRWNQRDEVDFEMPKESKGPTAKISPADPSRFRKPSPREHGAPAVKEEASYRYTQADWRENSKSRGIDSEQVGPERQVELSDEPMPLAKPKVKSAPKQITYQTIEEEGPKKPSEAANDDSFEGRVNKKASEIKAAKDKKTTKKNKDVDEPQL